MALVLSLGISVVLALSAVTVISSATSNTRAASTHVAHNAVEELALAGINDAAALLSLPSKNALNPSVFCLPSDSALLADRLTRRRHRHVLRVSHGHDVDDHLHRDTGEQERPEHRRPHEDDDGPDPRHCDVDSATQQPRLELRLVRGSLTLAQAQNTVGTALTKISDAHIAGGCEYTNNAFHLPCQGGLADNVWANVLDSTPSPITPPVVYWDSWYLNASPGPYYPFATSSGTPPTFDNIVALPTASDAAKLAYRNDSAGTFNLTPSTSYTCQNRGRRAVLERNHEDADGQRHDLHRRQRLREQRRNQHLYGSGDPLRVRQRPVEELDTLRPTERREDRL